MPLAFLSLIYNLLDIEPKNLSGFFIITFMEGNSEREQHNTYRSDFAQ